MPQTAPFNPPPVPDAPNVPAFAGHAPTPTPYGDFVAPNPLNFQQDPSYQFRLNEGTRALQHGAAARGTLLTGGTQKALQNYGQEAASQEYGNAFTRALQGYTANRETNAQNFGQQMNQFQGDLSAYGANTDATMGAGRLGLETYDRRYGAAKDLYGDAVGRATMQAEYNDANAAAQAEQYAQQVEAQRRQSAAARYTGPMPLYDQARLRPWQMEQLAKLPPVEMSIGGRASAPPDFAGR